MSSGGEQRASASRFGVPPPPLAVHVVECKEALLVELRVNMALPAAPCSANVFDPTAGRASRLPAEPFA